jgi:uncharacterized protein YciI
MRKLIENEMIRHMRYIFLLFCSFALLFEINAQADNREYDSVLARKLGADDYGMKSYVFVILKTGPNIMAAGPERDKLFKGHMDNINRLADEGKLVIAGPMGSNEKSYRGIFILNVKTSDEAKELLKSDPTVAEKIFDVEYYEWYGSAAISEYLQFTKMIEKKRQ